jgi:hypothetical protein
MDKVQEPSNYEKNENMYSTEYRYEFIGVDVNLLRKNILLQRLSHCTGSLITFTSLNT